jgi:hypothetical protein
MVRVQLPLYLPAWAYSALRSAQRTPALAKSSWHLRSTDDATHVLGPGGVRKNPQRKRQAVRHWMRNFRETLWYGTLDSTRPERHALGLRKKHATETTEARGDAVVVSAPRAGSNQQLGTK